VTGVTAGVILPLPEHDWLKYSHDKFGTHILPSWHDTCNSSVLCMDDGCHGVRAGKQL